MDYVSLYSNIGSVKLEQQICLMKFLFALQANDTWQSGCEICVCDSETLNYHCQPVTCPSLPPDSCDEPGKVLVNVTVDCCETYECSK